MSYIGKAIGTTASYLVSHTHNLHSYKCSVYCMYIIMLTSIIYVCMCMMISTVHM